MEKNGRFFEGKTSARPMIYAYEDASYPGCLKVGYTAVDVEKRVAQQYPTLRPEGKKPYRVIFAEPALYEDGSSFTDHAVHRMLEKKAWREWAENGSAVRRKKSGRHGWRCAPGRPTWKTVPGILPCARNRRKPWSGR